MKWFLLLRSLNQPLKIVIAAVVAGLLTSFALSRDLRHRTHQAENSALKYARQIGAQTETLFLDAREKGEPDPLGWVLNRLSQGSDADRPLRLTRTPIGSATPDGTHFFSNKTFEFDYYKQVQTEFPTGIKIHLQTEPFFFLGMASRFWADTAAFSLFSLLFLTLWLSWRGQTGERAATPRVTEIPHEPTAAQPAEPKSHELILAWAAESKALLARLGKTIKQILIEAKVLLDSSSQATHAVENTRTQFHSYLHDLNRGHDQVKQLRQHCEKLETVALNLIIEGSRIADADHPMMKMTSDLHQSIQKIRRTHSILETSLRRIQIGIEPWVKELDVAHNAHQFSHEAGKHMSEQIELTKDALMSQARHLQALQQQIQEQVKTAQVKAEETKVQADNAAKRAV